MHLWPLMTHQLIETMASWSHHGLREAPSRFAGEELVSPRDRLGMIPIVVPLTKNPTTGERHSLAGHMKDHRIVHACITALT